MAAANTWADHASFLVTLTEQGGKVRKYDLDDFVNFSMSEEKLKQQLLEQPGKFAYIAALFAAAMVKRERLEERVSVKKAELDKKIRSEAAASEVRITEEMVKNMVRTHKDYLAANEEYLQAREQEEVLRAIRDSLIQRKDIMVLVANNFRRERDTDPGSRVDRGAR